MTFISALGKLTSVFSPSHSKEELIEQPPISGNLFYEIIDIPKGPGLVQLQKLLTQLPPLDIKKGPWLAGGACRRLLQGQTIDSGDIDIFFRTRSDRKDFDKALSSFEIAHKSSMATTYKVGDLLVQTIKREHYLSLEDVFRDFDFSACQIASDGKWLAGTSQGIRDIKDHMLRFAPQGKVSKGTVINRMSKYLNHGFKPEPGLFNIMVQAGLEVTYPHNWFGDLELDENYNYDHGLDLEDSLWTEQVTAQILNQVYNDLQEKFGVQA